MEPMDPIDPVVFKAHLDQADDKLREVLKLVLRFPTESNAIFLMGYLCAREDTHTAETEDCRYWFKLAREVNRCKPCLNHLTDCL